VVSAVTFGLFAAGAVDENVTHHFRGSAKEMCAIFECGRQNSMRRAQCRADAQANEM
jgi:hypothetical protein